MFFTFDNSEQYFRAWFEQAEKNWDILHCAAYTL